MISSNKCKQGLTKCGKDCVDKSRNKNHCGSCDNKCDSKFDCINGICSCPLGSQLCNGQCVNTNTDSNNCGRCGNVCKGGTTCSNGTCVCPAGTELCNGQCVNLNTDNANCGVCGSKCVAGSKCTNGICLCPDGKEVCNGKCPDYNHDNINCGSCAHVCGNGTVCVDAKCVCPTDTTNCNGVCVDLSTNVLNCGKCGNGCKGGECINGKCIIPTDSCDTCPAMQTRSMCECSSNIISDCKSVNWNSDYNTIQSWVSSRVGHTNIARWISGDTENFQNDCENIDWPNMIKAFTSEFGPSGKTPISFMQFIALLHRNGGTDDQWNTVKNIVSTYSTDPWVSSCVNIYPYDPSNLPEC